MCDAAAVLSQARAAGLRLWRDGDQIAIAPARLCPPDLVAQIREAKPAILDLLEAEAAHLSLDQQPWLHVAKQVLAGEFDGGLRSEVESVLFGVRTIQHPVCQRARHRLETLLSRSRKEVR